MNNSSDTRNLVCHPERINPFVREITASVRYVTPQSLALRYVLTGDTGPLRIPPSCPPARTEGLWRHTCFEVFIGRAVDTAYWEFNFASSGAWAAFAFSDYRVDAPIPSARQPRIETQLYRDRLELVAEIEWDGLLETRTDAGLRLAVATVVEDRAGMLTYWALVHPPGRPDFHHPTSRVWTLSTQDS
ncbi:MAG: DOMON-like domain-containing protein [Gammaproteobacteria bacterium]|nr:DOMON-like domain-containing protein [Gammaproteobacteria bacterium]MCP5425273.1 DOMON-like domain-containing protein [Gammaproteobacteria bacterium]